MPPAVALQAVRDLSADVHAPALHVAINSATVILGELQGVKDNNEAREALSWQVVGCVLTIHQQFTGENGGPIDVPHEVLLNIAALNDSLGRTQQSLQQQDRRGGILTKLLRSDPNAEMLKAARQDIQRAMNLYSRQASILKLLVCHELSLFFDEVYEAQKLNRVIPVRANCVTLSLVNHRLPPPPCLLIGRNDELARAVDAITLWSSNHVAIVGVPGIGKTTLALSVLHNEGTAEQFKGRRFYISCAAHGSVSLLLASLGISDEQLVAFLRSPLPSLLLLDNLDDMLAGDCTAAEALINTLGTIENLTLLLTMRGGEIGDGSVEVERHILGPLSPQASVQLAFSESEYTPRFFTTSDIQKMIAEAAGVPLALAVTAHHLAWGFPVPSEPPTYVALVLALLAHRGKKLSQSGLAHLLQVQSDEPTLPFIVDQLNSYQSTVAESYTDHSELWGQSTQSVATISWSIHPTITTFYTARSDLATESVQSVATTFWSVLDIAVPPEIEDAEHLRDHFKELDVTHDIWSISQRPHGFGGTSDVMKAELDHMTVAVKVHRAIRPDASLLSRIAREIAVWRTLSHPNILPLAGLYWSGMEVPGMVSPWCSKGHLTSYIASLRTSLSSSQYTVTLMELLDDSLSGLAYLHSIGAVHGDLKGTNIMVADDGVACIADFGVSAVLTEYPPRSAEGAGTFRWMAPELLKPRPILTWASDIWAYGCVIIEVVTGERPFHDLAEEVQVILALDKGATPPRPSGIPDELWELCEQCFTLDSGCRPWAERLLADLQKLVD